jgi:hypothetical protein
MQNSTISLEEHQLRVDHAVMLAVAVEASDAPDEVKKAARVNATAKRMEHHPDHWFIDPGSGRETEDGRLRRRAIQACWADCPMKARLLCLDRGLQDGPTLSYGVYGGRTEKQRQEIVAAIKEREKKEAPGSTT